MCHRWLCFASTQVAHSPFQVVHLAERYLVRNDVSDPCLSPVCPGPASAIDFQQPLALQSLSVEWARVAEHTRKPNAVINGLSAVRADIADAINPANPSSPAQDIANKVIEQVQPSINTAQKVADALGNPDTAEAPKPSDYFPTSPPELLSVGRDVSTHGFSVP